MQESEAAAVARAKDGDGEAFRVLVERYGRSVFRLAFRMTGNEQDAEDVVQETFLRAYRQLAHYDGRATFHTWIYRIASNYALDLLRARRSGPAPAPEPEADLVCPRPHADRLAMSGQIGRQLRSAMAAMSGQERAAFVLRHFEGMSIDEIGDLLGLAESATKNSIFRAVQKLRRGLAPFVGGV